MGQVISLAERRARLAAPVEVEWSGADRPEGDGTWSEDVPFPSPAGAERFDDRRAQGELEAALDRLESAVAAGGAGGAPLDRRAETELLAVIGELALGY